jgi:virginiamycin B lyase
MEVCLGTRHTNCHPVPGRRFCSKGRTAICGFQNVGKVGRITTSGELTEYSTAGVWTAPMHIVAGPDGALWFTEVGGNALGRITTSGVLTEFPFGGFNTSPDGITVGADDRVWFTQWTANTLGAVIAPR